MLNQAIKETTWNFFSKIIIISLLALQIIRWSILPQFMDIYYHLLTAWGFIQAGGYSGWDFWQYAPVGRPHIYPPLFHLLLAGFLKMGINPVILAKLCETFVPVIMLIIIWKFIRNNYSAILAFFVVLVFLSSFSFYLSLLNHIPATLCFILGILALGQLFKKNILRSGILLSLCFYTHIGLSWFFALTFILYGLFYKETRKSALAVFLIAFILALPIVIKELTVYRFVTSLGFALHEKYLTQVKIVESILGVIGLYQTFKMGKEYRLFTAMFFASFIFIIYPYRFFSAEGYFPIILLCAFCLKNLYQSRNSRYIIFGVAVFILVFSPTFSMDKKLSEKHATYKVKLFDSAFINTLLAKGNILWFPNEYIGAAKIVKDNSDPQDITYCSFNFLGLTISSIAGRASANALLPEIVAAKAFSPLQVSKIIIFTRSDDAKLVDSLKDKLNLTKLGENKLFIIYKDTACQEKLKITKAGFPFWMVIAVSLVILLIFLLAGRVSSGLII